jgi:hypothetical protein
MLRHVIRTILFAMLLLGLVNTASAQHQNTCSTASLEGDWALTVTGTVFLPTGAAAPLATVGRLTFDASGYMSATQTNSVGGVVSQQETVKGNVVKLNPDCTGTFSVGVYDASGNLLRTAVFDFVIADNATEIRAIATSLTRNGLSVGPTLAFNARRLFPNRGIGP